MQPDNPAADDQPLLSDSLDRQRRDDRGMVEPAQGLDQVRELLVGFRREPIGRGENFGDAGVSRRTGQGARLLTRQHSKAGMGQ